MASLNIDDLPTYTWRGKTYKNTTTLWRAVMKAYPGTAQSFSATAMFLRYRDGKELAFQRTFTKERNSIIGDNPDPTIPSAWPKKEGK